MVVYKGGSIDLTIQNWYLSCEDPWRDTRLLHCQTVVLRFVGLISWLSANCVPLRLECLLDKEKEEMKNRSLGHDWHSHTPTIFLRICLMLVTLYCSILTLCFFLCRERQCPDLIFRHLPLAIETMAYLDTSSMMVMMVKKLDEVGQSWQLSPTVKTSFILIRIPSLLLRSQRCLLSFFWLGSFMWNQTLEVCSDTFEDLEISLKKIDSCLHLRYSISFQ